MSIKPIVKDINEFRISIIIQSTTYWVELAMKWYDNMPDASKASLVGSFEEIKDKKSLSQNLRNKIKMELQKP